MVNCSIASDFGTIASFQLASAEMPKNSLYIFMHVNAHIFSITCITDVLNSGKVWQGECLANVPFLSFGKKVWQIMEDLPNSPNFPKHFQVLSSDGRYFKFLKLEWYKYNIELIEQFSIINFCYAQGH